MNIDSIVVVSIFMTVLEKLIGIIFFQGLLKTALKKNWVCPDEIFAPAKTPYGTFGKNQS